MDITADILLKFITIRTHSIIVITLIMTRYQHLLELFIKHTPEVNKVRTAELFKRVNLDKRTERDVDPLVRYMDSLQIHRDYLEFFQIGVVRDQRSKIEKVAKYVGLAIREVEPLFASGIEHKYENKEKTKKN
jgi:hypothetical protein